MWIPALRGVDPGRWTTGGGGGGGGCTTHTTPTTQTFMSFTQLWAANLLLPSNTRCCMLRNVLWSFEPSFHISQCELFHSCEQSHMTNYKVNGCKGRNKGSETLRGSQALFGTKPLPVCIISVLSLSSTFSWI